MTRRRNRTYRTLLQGLRKMAVRCRSGDKRPSPTPDEMGQAAGKVAKLGRRSAMLLILLSVLAGMKRRSSPVDPVLMRPLIAGVARSAAHAGRRPLEIF